MPRPLTPAQALANTAFLDHLARTGNASASARAAGVAISTLRLRRHAHPDFAREWDAALLRAQATLRAAPPPDDGANPARPVARLPHALRTAGGEPLTGRGVGGRLQTRRAQPNRLTRRGEQAFLLALSACANVRLAAAAAGASPSVFYRRKRDDPAFAREWRAALAQGYARLEAELLAERDPASGAYDAWTRNDPPELPAMTVNQALQLMYLHQKEARLLAEPDHLKRRRGEPREAHWYRLAAMHRWSQELAREQFRVAEAAREARGEPRLLPAEAIGLPDLSQVMGWSKADLDKVAHDPGRALFGGWRIGAHDE